MSHHIPHCMTHVIVITQDRSGRRASLPTQRRNVKTELNSNRGFASEMPLCQQQWSERAYYALTTVKSDTVSYQRCWAVVTAFVIEVPVAALS